MELQMVFGIAKKKILAVFFKSFDFFSNFCLILTSHNSIFGQRLVDHCMKKYMCTYRTFRKNFIITNADNTKNAVSRKMRLNIKYCIVIKLIEPSDYTLEASN